MKGILNLLARANLVELSEEEQLRAAEQMPPALTEPPPEPPPPATEPPPPRDCEIAVDRALDEIYAAAKVPASPFPAEKLLRLLDGLRAQEELVARRAVDAFRDADVDPQIADSLLDAERKLAAINAYKQYLAAQVTGSVQQTGTRVGELQQKLEQTGAAIRQQIAELEQLLQREIARTAEETARLEAGLRATREAAAREIRRMDTEGERLQEIIQQFGAAPAGH